MANRFNDYTDFFEPISPVGTPCDLDRQNGQITDEQIQSVSSGIREIYPDISNMRESCNYIEQQRCEAKQEKPHIVLILDDMDFSCLDSDTCRVVNQIFSQPAQQERVRSENDLYCRITPDGRLERVGTYVDENPMINQKLMDVQASVETENEIKDENVKQEIVNRKLRQIILLLSEIDNVSGDEFNQKKLQQKINAIISTFVLEDCLRVASFIEKNVIQFPVISFVIDSFNKHFEKLSK